MDTKVIKTIVNGLPVTGDTFVEIKDGYAIYKSGGKVQISKSSRLQVGDIVIGVYHGHEDKSGQIKIIVNVDHQTSGSITDDSYYKEYVRIQREYKLEQIINDGND